MEDDILDSQASRVAAALGRVTEQLAKIDLEATELLNRDPHVWLRIKNHLDLQSFSSSILNRSDLSGEDHWDGAFRSWILPVVEARSTNLPTTSSAAIQPIRPHLPPPIITHSTPSVAVRIVNAPQPRQPSTAAFAAFDSPFAVGASVTYDEPDSTIDPQLLAAPQLPSPTSFMSSFSPFPNGSFSSLFLQPPTPLTPWREEEDSGSPTSELSTAYGSPKSPPLFGSDYDEPYPPSSSAYTPSISAMLGEQQQSYFDPSTFVSYHNAAEPRSPASTDASPPILNSPVSPHRHFPPAIAIREATLPMTDAFAPTSSQQPRPRSRSNSRAPEGGHSVGERNHHRRSISGSSTRNRMEPYPTSPTLTAIDLPGGGDSSSSSYESPASRSRPHSPALVGRRRASSAARPTPDEDDSLHAVAPIGTARKGHQRSSSATSFKDRPVDKDIPNISPSIMPMEYLTLDTSTGSTPVGSMFPPLPTRAAIRKPKSETNIRQVEQPPTREKRKYFVDESISYCLNTRDVFVVHVPERDDKVNVIAREVREVELDPDSNSPGSSLYLVTYESQPFSPEMLQTDFDSNRTYLFREKTSAEKKKKLPTKYHVTFNGHDREVDVKTVDNEGKLGIPKLPMTFVHFLPNSFVAIPKEPLGSPAWWRLIICYGKHLKADLEDGSWTARYDWGDKRRPARLVEHYATCPLRKELGYYDGVGRLATAVRALKPPSAASAKRKARTSTTTQADEDDDDSDEEYGE